MHLLSHPDSCTRWVPSMCNSAFKIEKKVTISGLASLKDPDVIKLQPFRLISKLDVLQSDITKCKL